MGTDIKYFQDSDGVNHQIDFNYLKNAPEKATTISSASTDDEYPTAKCVYDIVGNIETILNKING